MKIVIVFSNWSIEGFRNLHDEGFLFIKETELLTLKDHIQNIAHLVETSSFLEDTKSQILIHENEFVCEMRWFDRGETVTNVILLKSGKTWRSIVSRSLEIVRKEFEQAEIERANKASRVLDRAGLHTLYRFFHFRNPA